MLLITSLRWRATLAFITVLTLAGLLATAAPAAATPGDPVRPICFPVEGTVSWTDTFGAPRSGHTHEGQDLMGRKMQRLVATTDATVRSIKHDPNGNYVFLKDADGWQYVYIHINNDTPGTDDAANRVEEAFAPGLKVGQRVRAGEFIAYMGDSGNAENAGAHLHFEIRTPEGDAVNATESLRAASTCQVKVPSSTFAPFRTVEAFVAQQYRDLLHREPDIEGVVYWSNFLSFGDLTPSTMAGQLLGSAEFAAVNVDEAVAVAYQGLLDRTPDEEGLAWWRDRPVALVAGILESAEYAARVTELDAL